MSAAINAVVDQALELTAPERSDIIEKLLASLDIPDAGIDAIWGQESDARIKAYDKGEIKAIPLCEVFKKYQKL
ncbi:MAG: addiction module protein [Pseudomonadota bacterium]